MLRNYLIGTEEDSSSSESQAKHKSSDSKGESNSSLSSAQDSLSSSSNNSSSSDSTHAETSSSSTAEPKSSSSIEEPKSSASTPIAVAAKVMPSGTYNCSRYNCVTTEYLNQKLLADGEYGEILDERNNKVYKTIRISNQVWTAQNLDYPVEGRYSYCYDMDSTNCETHGYLYRWDTAINIDQCEYGVICDPPERTQGVCPAGWHIPSAKEWLDLFSNTINNGRVKSSAIGDDLKSSKGWNSGTHKDIYGFSAIPSGSMGGIGPGSGLGKNSGMWSSDEQGTYGAYMVSLDVERSTVWLYDESKALFLSIRCLMDSDKDPTDTTSFTGSSKQPTLNKDIQEGISVEDYMNSQVDYGTLTDKRDGQVYKITKIGCQWWMAENLRYADSIKTPSLVNGSWCYDDNDQRCQLTGRLYTWAAAIDSVKLESSSLKCGFGTSCNIPDRVQGICPEGWHLPNQTEWNDLVNKLGGNKVAGHILKAQSGWGSSRNGIDTYGFSGLPAGGRYYDNQNDQINYNYAGEDAFIWSSSNYDNTNAYYMRLTHSTDFANLLSNKKYHAFSVRCLKDY